MEEVQVSRDAAFFSAYVLGYRGYEKEDKCRTRGLGMYLKFGMEQPVWY